MEGMTWADLCVYMAFASLAGMFVVRTATIDIVLALAAVIFAVASCYLGMKSDPEFEDITNLFKALSYPAVVLFVAIVIAVHYMLIFKGHADYTGFGVSRVAERVNHFFRNAPGSW